MKTALLNLVRLDARTGLACGIFFLVGIVALSGLGRLVAATDYIDPNTFHRFHLYINPQTLYYPTASQVVALAKASVRRDQVAVILGGSSFIWGAGQSDEELWSRKLQTDLGDGYRVVNLAMPSGSPQEYGGVAAQALLKDGYKVVLVPDLGATFGPPDGLFYPYVYWDARYKGLLLDNPKADPRINLTSGARTTTGPLEELKLQGLVGGQLYFTDLWNLFSYKVLFTAWNWLVYPPTAQFFTPRGTLSDPQAHYPESQRHSSPPFDTAMDILRGYLATACPDGPSGAHGADSAALYWDSFRKDADAAFPDSFRSHVLIVRLFESRKYRDAFNADENACYAKSYAMASTELRNLGYQATEAGQDWTVDDYIDITHASPEGGVLLAQQLAGEVQSMSAELGYTDRGRM